MNAFIKTSLAAALAMGCAGISAPVLADGLTLTIENHAGDGYQLHASDMDHVSSYPDDIKTGSPGTVKLDSDEATVEYYIDKYVQSKDGNDIIDKEEICLATAKVSYAYSSVKCESIKFTFTSTDSDCAMSKVSCGSDTDCACTLQFTSTW